MRVVVAIDPAMTSGDEADETGIIVAGKDKNGHGYVLADLSGRNPPIEGQHRAARDIDAGHGTKDYVGIRVPRKQTYTLSGLADLIETGVRMVRPDIVKIRGFTGMWRCAAVAEAHGVEGAASDAADDRPHRQSPSCGKPAAYDKALRVERHDAMPALGLRKSPQPADGLFHLPTGPGLGLQINEAELAKRRVPIA